MNKINLTAAGSTLGTASYVSPEAKVTEIHSEGVLCMSFGSNSNNCFNPLDYQDGLEGW